MRANELVRRVPVEPAVFVVALLARVGVAVRHGVGVHGWFGYDASVYFAAADALTHGRVPYRDFVLLHPPGLMLALTPFAALTRVVSDPVAFTVAALACCAMGALNAALVTRLVGRLGLGRGAAVAGGLFYALWFGAVGAENLTRLEPLGNLLLLVALLAAMRAQRRGSAAAALPLGIALGLLVSVKIWWLPVAVAVVGWHAWRTRSGRSVAAALAGVGAAVAVVDLPFLLAAPRAMIDAVLRDQLGRPDGPQSAVQRLTDLSSVTAADRPLSLPAQQALALTVVLVLAALVIRAWPVRAARPAVALLLGQLGILLAAPSWFGFYTDYLAVAAAVTVAAAAAPLPRRGRAVRRRLRGLPWLATGAAGAVTVAALVLGTTVVTPYPAAARLARAVAGERCVMSDTPMAEIELDVLSRDLSDGCRAWVDVTGRTYGPDRGTGPAAGDRFTNRRWQRDLRAYLLSGDAVIVDRAVGSGITPTDRRALACGGVLARAGHQVVYRVRHPADYPRNGACVLPAHSRAEHRARRAGGVRASGVRV